MKLIVVGKTKEQFLQQTEAEYLKRLQRYIKLEYLEVPASKGVTQAAESLIQEEQGILKQIKPSDYVILLDESGKEYNSRAFAEQVNRWMVDQSKPCFVIGGAFGFSPAVKERSNAKLSLSKLTFPHHLVRSIFLEQLYRAMTILKGGKYHND